MHSKKEQMMERYQHSQAKVLCSAATGLKDFINKMGGSFEDILQKNHINDALLESSTASINLAKYCNIFEDAAYETKQDNFGLMYGYQFKPRDLGLLGYIAISSSSVQESLSNLIEAFPLHQQNTLLNLQTNKNLCYLNYEIKDHKIKSTRQDAELSLGMFFNIIKHACGTNWQPEKIYFKHAKPLYWEEHAKVFDCPVIFNHHCNSLVFDQSVLGMTMPTQDVNLLRLIQESLHQLETNNPKAMTNYEEDFLLNIKHCILQNLENPELSLDIISEKLRIPSWTLQRRLGKIPINFSKLLDEIRQEQAILYLDEQNIPLSEIAFLLGYAEISSFSRAFRRWFGVSPKQWVKMSA